MKWLLCSMAVLVLVGCDNGRYQIATISTDANTVWRIDTRTGEITKCLRGDTLGVAQCGTPGK